MNRSKRAFFKRRHAASLRLPLPWQIEESQFTEQCTRCDQCLVACEENIIVKGDGGFPTISFSHNACTFCYACAQACPEKLFYTGDQKPFEHVAQISEGCLAQQFIECRSCGDSCDDNAIQFELRIGGAATPSINNQQCSGCGACVAVCPTQSITMQPWVDSTPQRLLHATK